MTKNQAKKALKGMDPGPVLDAIVAAIQSQDAHVTPEAVVRVYEALLGDVYFRSVTIVDQLIEEGKIGTFHGI